jgi:hypothetical protein
MVACPKLSTTLDQFQRPQPAQGVVETAVIRLVPRLCCNPLFRQRLGIDLSECLQNQPLRLPQTPAPVVDQCGTRRKRFP